MARPADPILQALESFTGSLGGQMIFVRQGDLIDADHPAVRQWPTKFGPLTVQFRTPRATEPRIEDATSAVARKRGE